MKSIKHFMQIKLYWINKLHLKTVCFFKGHKHIRHSQEMPNIKVKFKSIKLCSRCGEWEQEK